MRIGLIADTHNLLRPEAIGALAGCGHIIHAGDVCGPAILEQLRRIAPVTAVRGNNDRGRWADALPAWETAEFGAVLVYVRHDLSEIDIDPAAAGFHVVVTGHSHRPAIETREGVLYVNPGSAGPRRFRLPVAVAALEISGNRISPRIIDLAV